MSNTDIVLLIIIIAVIEYVQAFIAGCTFANWIRKNNGN
jgi:hypothetical protein